MDRKQFAIECREKRMKYREIAQLLGVSRQRIHQIITGYVSPRHQKSYYKPIEVNKLKIWTKRKRKYLGLPEELYSYSGGIDFIREIIRQRDNNTCQKCFKKWIEGTRKLDVHHLDKKIENSMDIKYDRENIDKMITLCHKCHLNLHSVRRKMSIGKKLSPIPTSFPY